MARICSLGLCLSVVLSSGCAMLPTRSVALRPTEQYIADLRDHGDRMFESLGGLSPVNPTSSQLTDHDAYLFELICYVAETCDSSTARDIFLNWGFKTDDTINRQEASYAY